MQIFHYTTLECLSVSNLVYTDQERKGGGGGGGRGSPGEDNYKISMHPRLLLVKRQISWLQWKSHKNQSDHQLKGGGGGVHRCGWIFVPTTGR